MDFSQATLLFVVASARCGFRYVCAAMAAGLGSERTRGIQDNRPDVFRLHSRPCRSCLDTRLNRGSVGDGDVRQLVFRARLPFPARAPGRPSFPAVPRTDGCAFGTDRAILGDIPTSRARFSALLPSPAPVRIRIFARIRCWFVRSAGGRMGDGGHHFGVAHRILPAADGPGGKRSSRLRGVSRLRHRIAVGRVRHQSLGGDGFVCRRPSRDHWNPNNNHLPAFSGGGGRKGGAGSVLGMASSRDGRPHAIQRDFLWRYLDSRRRVSPAPHSAHAGPVPIRFRFGDRHRRCHSRTRHHCRPGERRRENLTRVRVA